MFPKFPNIAKLIPLPLDNPTVWDSLDQVLPDGESFMSLAKELEKAIESDTPTSSPINTPIGSRTLAALQDDSEPLSEAKKKGEIEKQDTPQETQHNTSNVLSPVSVDEYKPAAVAKILNFNTIQNHYVLSLLRERDAYKKQLKSLHHNEPLECDQCQYLKSENDKLKELIKKAKQAHGAFEFLQVEQLRENQNARALLQIISSHAQSLDSQNTALRKEIDSIRGSSTTPTVCLAVPPQLASELPGECSQMVLTNPETEKPSKGKQPMGEPPESKRLKIDRTIKNANRKSRCNAKRRK